MIVRCLFKVLFISLLHVLLDITYLETHENGDDLNAQKYFKLELVSSDLVHKFTIATYKQTSAIQCRHRCNRKKGCIDVFIAPGNMCLLLGGSGGYNITAPDGGFKISKIKMLKPG